MLWDCHIQFNDNILNKRQFFSGQSFFWYMYMHKGNKIWISMQRFQSWRWCLTMFWSFLKQSIGHTEVIHSRTQTHHPCTPFVVGCVWLPAPTLPQPPSIWLFISFWQMESNSEGGNCMWTHLYMLQTDSVQDCTFRLLVKYGINIQKHTARHVQ